MRILLVAYYRPPKLGVGVFMENLIPHLVPELKSRGVKVDLLCNAQFLKDAPQLELSFGRIIVSSWLNHSLSTIAFMLIYFPLFYLMRGYAACLLMSNPVASIKLKGLVSVIHDLNEFEDSRKYGIVRTFYRKYIMLGGAFRNSTQLVAISNHVKQQIKKYYGSGSFTKTIVIPNGIKKPGTDSVCRSKDDTYLIVGRVDPRGKNLWDGIKIFDSIVALNPNAKLLLVGGISDSTRSDALTFLQSIQERPCIKYLGYVSETELTALYLSATAVIFYSKLEGFGFPVLEAFSYGCPVISHPDNLAAKEISSNKLIEVPEVLLVNKSELGSYILEKIALGEPDELKKVANTFSWHNSSNEYANVLMNVALKSGK